MGNSIRKEVIMRIEELIKEYNEYIEKLEKNIKNGLIIVDHIPTIEEYYCNLDLKGEDNGDNI